MAHAYLDTADDTYDPYADGAARLERIIVGTKATGAVVTVYEGHASTADSVAVIDAATNNGTYEFCEQFSDGVFVALTGGNAKVTVIAA